MREVKRLTKQLYSNSPKWVGVFHLLFHFSSLTIIKLQTAWECTVRKNYKSCFLTSTVKNTMHSFVVGYIMYSTMKKYKCFYLEDTINCYIQYNYSLSVVYMQKWHSTHICWHARHMLFSKTFIENINVCT